MKKSTSLIFTLLISIFIFSNCEDDDQSSSNNFESSCCANEPLLVDENGGKLYLPNAFSPNNDGINDLFVIHADQGIQSIMSFTITDGNGSEFLSYKNFQPNDIALGWDGTISNGIAVEGIFNYRISVLFANGSVGNYSGKVCSRASTPQPCVINESDCRWPVQHDGEGGLNTSFDSFEQCE